MYKKLSGTTERLLKDGIASKPIGITDWYDHFKHKDVTEEMNRIEEKKRIEKIECPSCKSTNKEHVVKRNNNGILGPGYRSWVVDEHFVCKQCGTMFKDINKNNKE